MNIKEEKFSQFYLEHFAIAYKFALREIGNSYAAEDLVQNTYLSALEKEIIVNHERPVSWLYTALKYNILMYYRENNKSMCLLSEITDGVIDKEYVISELTETFRTILTQEEYYLVHKIYFSGFSEREVANELNITENAVRMRMIKIKKEIIKSLSSFCIIVILILHWMGR